jgi:hypothetical protein
MDCMRKCYGCKKEKKIALKTLLLSQIIDKYDSILKETNKNLPFCNIQ